MKHVMYAVLTTTLVSTFPPLHAAPRTPPDAVATPAPIEEPIGARAATGDTGSFITTPVPGLVMTIPPPSSTMSVARCIELLNAITSLDPMPGVSPLKLGSARLTLGLNSIALRPVADAIEATRKALIREYSGGKDSIEAASPQGIEFLAKFQEVMDRPCPVTLARLKFDDLHLDVNEISIPTINSLSVMLDK